MINKFRFNKIFFIVLLQISVVGYSRVHDFETTRMKSTSGAGVATALQDESTFLNPSTPVFYNNSSLYFQKLSQKFNHEDDQATSETDLPQEGDGLGVVVSDSKGGAKGSFSYVKQKEYYSKRSRLAISLASPIAKFSGFGMTLRRTVDTDLRPNTESKENTYYQTIFGISHAVDEEFSIGVVLVDPFKRVPEDTRLILGGQYTIKKLVTLIIDVGTDYNYDLSEYFLYKGAIQIKALSEFYLRMGVFKDNGLKEQGNSIGLAWVGQQVTIEGAYKNTDFLDLNNPDRPISFYLPNKSRDFSLSLSYRF